MLHEQLGRGTDATVHAATDRVDGSQCVIKRLAEPVAHDPNRRYRFTKEATILRALQGEAVAQLLSDVLTSEGAPYFVMEKLLGEDLRRTLEREVRLPWKTTCDLMRQVGDVMRAVHRAGLLHGDLKPENVFVCQGAAEVRVRLLDFGSARRHTDDYSGECSGTPEYLAPEWERRRTHTIRGDIYAWGVMTYECLTGRLPFRDPDDLGILLRARDGRPPTFAEIVPWLVVPADLEHLVLKALHPRPEKRQSSFDEVIRDLDEVVGSAGRGPPPRRRTRLLPGRSFHVLPRWLLVVPMLAIVAGAAWYLLRGSPPLPPPPPPGRTTLVWQHGNTGRIKVWLIRGLVPQQTFDLRGEKSEHFTVVGSGDFNADGKTDLLWYNTKSHQAATWNVTLGASSPARTGSLISGYRTNAWELADAGDFDGSGADDLLWQHRTHARVAICLMAAGVQDTCSELVGPSDDPLWRVRATTDLDGDRNDDIVWQNVSDHRVTIWSMRGAEILRSANLADLGGANWSVAGVGRLTTAETPEILMVDPVTSAVSVSTHGGAPRVIGTAPRGYRVVAIDDFDTDGRDDIVWQQETSEESALATKISLLHEGNNLEFIDIPGGLSLPWHIVTAARL